MNKYFIIAVGGAFGAVLRYVISNMVYSLNWHEIFPWGTVAVNVIGSFFLGFLFSLSNYVEISPHLRIFIFIGFIGAFTTFSTYIVETFTLLKGGKYKCAFNNFLFSNILAFIAVIIGVILAKYFMVLLKK